MRLHSRLAYLAAALAIAAGSFVMAVDSADARAGRGGSSGSRGSNTYSAPPSTATSPGQAAPINRSMTQPGQTAPTAGAATAAGGAAAAQPSRFGGMKGLLLGGLIGAGLASMLGAGALANVLGFILQMALIAGAVFLVVAFFRSRSANKPALATADAGRSAAPPNPSLNQRLAASSLGGAAAAVNVSPEDFSAFERLLGEIQGAYGRNDIDALGQRVTPEMLSYFAQELDEDAKKGHINHLTDVKLLQGDLAEAWREGTLEYATVAMRYSLIDATLEAKTGRLVSGSKDEPAEGTEIWTFVRPANGRSDHWELSAIQQTE